MKWLRLNISEESSNDLHQGTKLGNHRYTASKKKAAPRLSRIVQFLPVLLLLADCILTLVIFVTILLLYVVKHVVALDHLPLHIILIYLKVDVKLDYRETANPCTIL